MANTHFPYYYLFIIMCAFQGALLKICMVMQAIHNALQQEEKCATYAISKETAKEAVRIMRVLVHEKKELLNEADVEVRLLV